MGKKDLTIIAVPNANTFWGANQLSLGCWGHHIRQCHNMAKKSWKVQKQHSCSPLMKQISSKISPWWFRNIRVSVFKSWSNHSGTHQCTALLSKLLFWIELWISFFFSVSTCNYVKKEVLVNRSSEFKGFLYLNGFIYTFTDVSASQTYENHMMTLLNSPV